MYNNAILFAAQVAVQCILVAHTSSCSEGMRKGDMDIIIVILYLFIIEIKNFWTVSLCFQREEGKESTRIVVQGGRWVGGGGRGP